VPNFSDFRAVFVRNLVKGGYEPIFALDNDKAIFALDNDKAISATGNSSMTLNIDYSMVFGDYDNFKTYDNMGCKHQWLFDTLLIHYKNNQD
jgi:hypothetical protein